MKHKLFRFLLKTIAKVAAYFQVGTHFGKAPRLVAEPLVTEKIYGPLPGSHDINVWQFRNMYCSSQYGGAMINGHNQVFGRFITFPWGKDTHPVITLPYIGKKHKTLDKAIFLITPEAKGNYFHWIADSLPRLLLLIKIALPDLRDRVIIIHNSNSKYERDTFKILGIEESKIVRIKPFELVKAEDLIVPDFFHSSASNAFPLWKKELLDQFKNKVLAPNASNKGEKIYLLRGNQKKRNLIGEEALVEVLIKYGFKIVNPQKLTLSEQIATLSTAEVVVGLHGAALTNIIFCKEKTLVIELRSVRNAPEFYSEISKTYNLNFEYIELPSKASNNNYHLANKADLILTEESKNALLKKIDRYIDPYLS